MTAYGFIVRKNDQIVESGARIAERGQLIRDLRSAHGDDAEIEFIGTGTDDSLPHLVEDAERISKGLEPLHARSPIKESGEEKVRVDQVIALMKQFAESRQISAEKAHEIAGKGSYAQMVADYIYSGQPPLEEIRKFLETDPSMPPPKDQTPRP